MSIFSYSTLFDPIMELSFFFPLKKKALVGSVVHKSVSLKYMNNMLWNMNKVLQVQEAFIVVVLQVALCLSGKLLVY